MKTFIVTSKQLREYVEKKKSDKVFYEIISDMYLNRTFLNENVSLSKANQAILDKYRGKNVITQRVNEMLIKYGIMVENTKLIVESKSTKKKFI